MFCYTNRVHCSLIWMIAGLSVAAWNTGCGGDEAGGRNTDSGVPDATFDAMMEDTGMPDVGIDAGPDGSSDASLDASSDGGPTRTADLSCTTTSVSPPLVANPTTVSGRVASSGGAGIPTPLANATVRAMTPRDGSAVEVASTTSGLDGVYSITIPTEGRPWVGYLRSEASGHRATNLFLPLPFFMEMHTNIHLIQLTDSGWEALKTYLSQTDGNGVIAALVVDCSGTPIEGATISAGEGLIPLYTNTSGFPAPGESTGADGRASFVNVPVGSRSVTAIYEGVSFLPQDVYVIANEMTTVVLSPYAAEAARGSSSGS